MIRYQRHKFVRIEGAGGHARKKAFPPLLLAGLFAVIFLVASANSTAVAAAAKTPPPPPDMRKLIKSVDLKSSSVVIIYMHSHLQHAYAIDGSTDLKINNVTGKIADIKPGMVVDDYLERDNDTLDGLSLSGYGTTPSPAQVKSPPKPKPPAQT